MVEVHCLAGVSDACPRYSAPHICWNNSGSLLPGHPASRHRLLHTLLAETRLVGTCTTCPAELVSFHLWKTEQSMQLGLRRDNWLIVSKCLTLVGCGADSDWGTPAQWPSGEVFALRLLDRAKDYKMLLIVFLLGTQWMGQMPRTNFASIAMWRSVGLYLDWLA